MVVPPNSKCLAQNKIPINIFSKAQKHKSKEDKRYKEKQHHPDNGILEVHKTT